MKITIQELKVLCEKILTEAEMSNIKEIDIPIDYYWSVGFDDAYNMNKEIPDLIVGSFEDDWQNLKKIIETKNTPTIVDIERLGNVIKILGDSIHKSDKIY